MEIQKPEQASSAQSEIGRNRPTPSFVPASVAATEPVVQETAAAQNVVQLGPPSYSTQPDAGATNTAQQEAQLDVPAPTLPLSEPTDYTIPVDEVLIRLHEIGIKKSKDSIQRYCREGALDCKKLGLFKRYFATEKSLAALIEKMQPDEDARACIQLNAPASNGVQVHQAEDEPNANREPQPKSTNDETGSKTTGNENLVDFLKEEICVKNKQLEVKDTQIAAMLERDHETNILIRGLQNHLGETFAVLAGRSNREESKNENSGDFRN